MNGKEDERPDEAPDPMTQDDALSKVRGYVHQRRIDTNGYPLSRLVAHRFSCGWMVYVPVPKGQIAIGRAIFYVADDGVVEMSTSSVGPRTFIAGFEMRFLARLTAMN